MKHKDSRVTIWKLRFAKQMKRTMKVKKLLKGGKNA